MKHYYSKLKRISKCEPTSASMRGWPQDFCRSRANNTTEYFQRGTIIVIALRSWFATMDREVTLRI